MRINPFNITKANDYSDEEIYSSWVDMPGGGFAEIVKPTSPMPIIILGGKGSGKTHIMRFFSYNLQKLRYGKELIRKISEDKYIGIHMRSSGLNSHRFVGKGQSDEVWASIFTYYMELWISQLVLSTIDDLFKSSIENFDGSEEEICKEIVKLFDISDKYSSDIFTFSEVLNFIKSLQKTVDYAVNNIAITGKNLAGIDIMVSPGKLIFEIPKILVNSLEFLKDCQFLYLIDEFENLTELQQKYINTLLRERRSNHISLGSSALRNKNYRNIQCR